MRPSNAGGSVTRTERGGIETNATRDWRSSPAASSIRFSLIHVRLALNLQLLLTTRSMQPPATSATSKSFGSLKTESVPRGIP